MGENQTVIVAIPARNDYVWNISSQKVPHLTLLYLGDALSTAEDYQAVVEFLEHVANTTVTRFGLPVDHRDVLGPEDADVLFFKDQNATKKLEDLRHALRQNDVISSAYNSTEQFPKWIPHLTLGYPDDPAKEDDRDYPGIHWVEFDRIALWNGDYEGPEFRLKDYEDMEVAMSDDLSSFLAHFGVRGMKWGVRRSDSSVASENQTSGKPNAKYVAPKQADKNAALMAFVRQNGRGPNAGEVAAGLSSDGSQAHVFVVKGVTVTPESDGLGTTRTTEMVHVATIGVNKDNTVGETLYENPNVEKDLQHDDVVGDFLAHYGIRGMKWGVRRSDAQLSGGKKKGETPDAETALSEFIRNNTTPPSTMSDDEIRDTIARANLLRQYDSLLNPGSASNAALRAHVEKLELEAKERQLKANANSAKIERVNQLIKTSANGFEAYSKLDKATGGTLGAKISESLYGKKRPSQIDKLSEENKLLELARKNIEARAKLNETRATRGDVAIGDAASRAAGYAGAGKRRAGGAHKN